MNLEGLIQVLSSIVPTNLNPRQWIARAEDVKGADQSFELIDDLIEFHPFKMKKGMKARVSNYPTAGVVSEYILSQNPDLMVDGNKESIVTSQNFLQFWTLSNTTNTSTSRVYNYSPDGPGGGAPLFPYIDNPDAEPQWEPIYDKTKGHRWLRFRDDDEFVIVQNSADEDVKIYTNWTVPIAVNQNFEAGDYIENKFMRYAISPTIVSALVGLAADKWYIVLTGTIQASNIQPTSRLYAEYLRIYGPNGTTPLDITQARIFQYETENTWVFTPGTTVQETVPPPPRIINSLPNNDAVYPADFAIAGSWTDSVPAGSDQLWKLFGPKSVYQQLKGDWQIEKVNENANYIRYSNTADPHPDTLTVDPLNTAATSGSAYDTALLAAGWVSVYDKHDFMATRKDDPGLNDYTPWIVEKIREESGEYEDNVYKLGPLYADDDDPAIPDAPLTRDPTTEGWADVPLEESETQINYVSSARKFFNGALKTAWSTPVPYTGKSTFKDDIVSDKGDEFKYSVNGSGAEVVSPDYIILTSRIFKGLSKLWEDSAITIQYTWWKVFDNNAAVDPIQEAVTDADPVANPAILFGYMPASGTPGTPGSIRNKQSVIIRPNGVNGKTVFRVRQRVFFTATSYQDFIQEYSIIDISDGLDAKTVVLTSDINLAIWDSGDSVVTPAEIQMRYYQNNLNPADFRFKYQKKWSSPSWVNAVGQAGISITDNVLTIDTSNTNIFTQSSARQEIRIAIMNWDGDPTTPDPDINRYSDIVTIVKLSSTNVGEDGQDSVAVLLSNESHTIVLNSETGSPLTGEIGSTGAASTIVQLYEGLTKKDYTTHWTITGITSDNGSVTFAHTASGTDRKVYVNTWGAGQRKAKGTITIAYGALTLTREFSVASSLDAPGAIILDIDSNKGFSFDGNDRTAKTLTAKVYNDQVTGGLDDPTNWYFKWFINGVAVQGPTQGGSPSNGQTRVVNHADVRFSANLLVMIADNPTDLTGTEVPFRTRSVKIVDVTDTQQLIMWTDLVAKPSASPPTSYKGGTATVVAGGATWRKSTDSYWSTNSPIWASEGTENPAGAIDPGDGKPYWTWTQVYRIKGETGSQGQAGGFAFEMYISSGSNADSVPAFGAGGNTSTIAQMVTAGWRSSSPGQMPTSGYIWKTWRFYSSRNAGGTDITFDANGYPVNGVAFAGSSWITPTRITSKDGTNGTGNDGANGWSPQFGIVSGAAAATKVMQLVNWINGSGSNPGFVGQYIGPSGFTSDINSAVNIAGVPVEMRYDSSTSFIQWKYTDEGAGAWRNILRSAPTDFVNSVVTPGTDITITTGMGEVILATVTLGAKPYSRRVIINGAVQLRSDDSGNDDRFNLWLSASLNGGTYSTISPFVTGFRPMVGTDIYEVATSFMEYQLNANTSITIRLVVTVFSGGGARYSARQLYAHAIPS